MGWLKCLSFLGCALILVNPSCHGAVWTEEDEVRALQQGQGRVSHATPGSSLNTPQGRVSHATPGSSLNTPQGRVNHATPGSSLNTPDAHEEGRTREPGRDDVRGRQGLGRFPQDSRDFGSNPQLVNLRQKEESNSEIDRLRQYGEGRVLQRNTGRLHSLKTPYTQYEGRFPQNSADFPQNEGRYPQNEGRYPQKGRYSQNEGRYPQYRNRQGGGSAEFSQYDGRTQDVETETRYEDPQEGYETRKGRYETLYEDGRTQDDASEAFEAQPDGRAQEPKNPIKIQLDENVESTDTAGKRRISFDFLENAVEQKSSEKECLSCHIFDEKKPAEQEVDNRKAEAAKSDTGYLQDTLVFISGLFQGEKPAPARQEYLPRNPEPINPKFGTPGFNGRTLVSLRPHAEYRSSASSDFNARQQGYNGGRQEFSTSNYGQDLDGRQEALNDGRQTDVNEDGWIDSFDSEEEYLKYRLQQLENPSESTGYPQAGYEDQDFGQNQPIDTSASGNQRFGSQRYSTEPVQEDAKLDYLEYRRQQKDNQNDQINLDNRRFGQNDRLNSRFGEQNQGGRISDAQSEYLKYRQEQFYDPRQNVQPNLNKKSRFVEQNIDGRTKGDTQAEYLKYRQEQHYDSQFYDYPVQDVQSNQVEESQFENTRFGDLDQGIFNIYHPEEAEQLDYLQYRRTEDGSKPADCSCNGVIDENKEGECLSTWNGEAWCYVDPDSGCSDTKLWEGEYGLQTTYSYLACTHKGFGESRGLVEEYPSTGFESPQDVDFGQESLHFDNFRQKSYEAPPQKTEEELAFEARRIEAELAFQAAEARRQAALEAEKAKLQAAKEAFEEEINRLRRQGCSSCHLVLEDAALQEGNTELLNLGKKEKKPLKVSKLMDLEDESVEAPRSVKSPRDGCVTCHLIQPPSPQPAPILEVAEKAGHLKVPILVEVDKAGKTTPLQKRDPSGALDLRKAASFRASTFMETKEDRPFIPRPGPAPSRRGSSGSYSRRGSSGNERPLNAAQRRLRPKVVRPKVRGCRSCHVLQ